MKIKVAILRPGIDGKFYPCHDYIMDHDKDDERRHLGFLCRYLFDCGWGIYTVPHK